MTKLEMAHDYAIEMLKRGDPEHKIAFDAWSLADAMQAEAEKRNDMERPAVLREAAPEYDPTLEYPHDAKVTFRGKVVGIQDIEGSRFWF